MHNRKWKLTLFAALGVLPTVLQTTLQFPGVTSLISESALAKSTFARKLCQFVHWQTLLMLANILANVASKHYYC